MIASNSFCKPRSAAAEPTSQTCSIAKSQAQSAVNMKSDTFTRRTGTPTFFAALASPPTAKIQFPKRVCVSRYEAAMAMNAHQRMTLGMPRTGGLPSSRVAIQPCFPAQVKSSFANVPENRKRTTGSCAARSPMPLTMVRFAKMIERASVRPRRMKRNPSVTMKEGSPVFTTSVPLTQPMKSAQARARSIDSQTGQPKKSGGPGQHPREAHHRNEREVELPRDHQEAGPGGDDAEIGRDDGPVDHP